MGGSSATHYCMWQLAEGGERKKWGYRGRIYAGRNHDLEKILSEVWYNNNEELEKQIHENFHKNDRNWELKSNGEKEKISVRGKVIFWPKVIKNS